MSAAPTAETATVQHSGTTDKEEKKKKTKQSIAIREWTEEEYRHAPFTSLSFRFLPWLWFALLQQALTAESEEEVA